VISIFHLLLYTVRIYGVNVQTLVIGWWEDGNLLCYTRTTQCAKVYRTGQKNELEPMEPLLEYFSVMHWRTEANNMHHQRHPHKNIQNTQYIYIYVLYRLWGPYWKNILPRSHKRPRDSPEAEEKYFLVRTDLNGK
jgi:hypothetical protein